MTSHDGWTVDTVTRESIRPVFGDARPCTVAHITHDTGATMSLSRYAGEPGWGVDSAIGANGMPHWVHGAGDRTVSVRMLDESTLTAELDTRAGELERETTHA